MNKIGSTGLPDATHTKFQDQRSVGSGEEDFCHTWALWPSWSYDPTHSYKFSFPISGAAVE